jgi:streptogramin lyase
MTLEDAHGAIWVATDNGLNVLDPASGKFRRLRHDPADATSLSSDRVQSLFQDRQGTLWVGTNGGLNRLVRDAGGAVHFRRYTTRDGLADDSIGAILEADDGQLWLSTANGIARMDPHRAAFKNYSARDGMIEGYYFAGSAFRDDDGTMYFGGVNGLTAFHPAAIRDNPYAPPAVVTSMQVGGRVLRPSVAPAGLTAPPRSVSNSRRCTTAIRSATASATGCAATTATGPRATPASASPPTPTSTPAITCSRCRPPTRTACGARPRRRCRSRSSRRSGSAGGSGWPARRRC